MTSRNYQYYHASKNTEILDFVQNNCEPGIHTLHVFEYLPSKDKKKKTLYEH